jgi:hypothetical protein
VAWASRATTLAITSRHVARRQTLSVNFAKSLGGAASRLKIKVTAVARSGSRVTRYRTVQLRPAGFVAAQSARSAYVPA